MRISINATATKLEKTALGNAEDDKCSPFKNAVNKTRHIAMLKHLDFNYASISVEPILPQYGKSEDKLGM